uniref:Small G protein signalling modulator 1/2 Rab-binding domain-containing protein n=1 Tax=Arundo donax TaxID=35708 RepID=A0A0A9CRR8_ARUDO
MRGAAAAEGGSPRTSELYDLSDDSDYADAAASGHTAMRSDSAESGADEMARVDVVYEKERVTIHPTQYGSGRISGKLRLFLQRGSLFLSWEPNDGVDSLLSSSVSMEIDKYRNLYTIKDLPLSDVRFIRRHTPTFGLDYIIIVLSSGLAFPPFYFYNGGIRELFATLKQHVFIIRFPFLVQ